MRIGVFTNNYKPIISGVAESIESFRGELEKRGHQVFVFAPNFPGYKDENPNVFRFRSLNVKYKTAFPIAVWSPEIFKKAKRLDLDIIHSQHPFNAGKAALRYARRLGVPIVFTNHTRYDMYTHFIPLLPQKFLKNYAISASVNYANNCDAVIAPSRTIKEMLTGFGVKRKISVAPAGIDIEKFKYADRDEIRRRFQIKDEEILLITISRIAKEKNIEFLLKSFSKTISGISGAVKYMIVGDGEDMERIKKIAKDLDIEKQMIFTGAVPHDKIQNYFKAGDLFLHSSLSETQGIIIAEAMAAGLPIIAVKAPGIQDIIESEKDGILTAENEGEFAEKIKLLAKDRKLRNRISSGAREKAKEYSKEKCAERLIEIYKNL